MIFISIDDLFQEFGKSTGKFVKICQHGRQLLNLLNFPLRYNSKYIFIYNPKYI